LKEHRGGSLLGFTHPCYPTTVIPKPEQAKTKSFYLTFADTEKDRP
jgi:hypothetical protein